MFIVLCRYNGGEGFVPGAMFKKFDKRQATVYVKKVRMLMIKTFALMFSVVMKNETNILLCCPQNSDTEKFCQQTQH